MNSNRTVAGLKRAQLFCCQVTLSFQSNRCGVETNDNVIKCFFCNKFQSNRCGVETDVLDCFCFNCLFQSNRCGVETLNVSSSSNESVIFQSNRCGVETFKKRCTLSCIVDSNRTVAGLKRNYFNNLRALSIPIEPLRG